MIVDKKYVFTINCGDNNLFYITFGGESLIMHKLIELSLLVASTAIEGSEANDADGVPIAEIALLWKNRQRGQRAQRGLWPAFSGQGLLTRSFWGSSIKSVYK